MHYGSYFFSKNNQPTILKSNGDVIVAQRVELKSGDLQEIRSLYNGYIKGDCVGFNYNRAELKKINGDWKIVDGSHWMFSFGNKRAEGRKASHYKIISHDKELLCGAPRSFYEIPSYRFKQSTVWKYRW